MTEFFYWSGVLFWSGFLLTLLLTLFFAARWKHIPDSEYDPNEDIPMEEWRW